MLVKVVVVNRENHQAPHSLVKPNNSYRHWLLSSHSVSLNHSHSLSHNCSNPSNPFSNPSNNSKISSHNSHSVQAHKAPKAHKESVVFLVPKVLEVFQAVTDSYSR